MTRYVLIVLALFLAAPASGRSKRPPVLEVKLSLGKRKVDLLDEVEMTITVRNRGRSTVELPPLRISDESVTLVLTEGEKTFRVRRIFGTWRGDTLVPDVVAKSRLRRSRKVSEKLTMFAIRPGTYEVTAEVRGVEGMTEPANSRPVELTVSPPPEGKHLRARLRTDKGTMTAELYVDDAYNTCHEFVCNAESGLFDGIEIYRIIENFMVQTGCPKNNGTGDAGHHVPAEINERQHVRGALSMARRAPLDSAGSSFFIVHVDKPGLDGKYAVFGKVIEGLDVLDAIATVPVGPNGRGEKSKPLGRVELEGVDIEVR